MKKAPRVRYKDQSDDKEHFFAYSYRKLFFFSCSKKENKVCIC